MSKFWQFKNEAGADPELMMYGPISDSSWWGDEVTPKQFAEDLRSLGNPQNINVRINSVGGDVFAATAIYTMLRDHPANVTVKIDGLAASAATIVAMAGNTIKAPSNALMMIHNPLLVLFGAYNADDMEKMADVLDTVKESIINAYVAKTGRDRKELAKMMDKETWMTAEEAKGEGFIDEIMFDEPVNTTATNDGRFMIVNSVVHDLSRFQTRPNPTNSYQEKQKNPLTAAWQSFFSPKNIKEEPKLEIKNLDDLKKAHPDLVAQIQTDAIKNEQARIAALDALNDPGNPTVQALIADAKNTGKTADEIKNTVEIVKKNTPAPATKDKAANWLDGVAKDTANSGVDGVGTDAAGSQTEAQEAEAAIANMAKLINKQNGRDK